MPAFVFVWLFVAVVVGLAGGFGAAYLLLRRRQSDGSQVLELKAQQTLLEAETQAKEKLLEAKEEAVKVRTAAEQEAREYRAQSQQIERRLLQKEENLDRKAEDVNRSERELANQKKSLDDIKAQLEESYRQQEKELQRVANMTRQEAQGILMAQVEQDLRNEVARKVRESELAARDESERRAREIVTESIQRIAADQTAEVSVSVLPLPTDELKGRIIGKEGRNIRALQQATGIDLIVDDTPEAVIGADVRIAKLSGLLHDIGKSIDHEVEGSHAVIGADLLQRHAVPAQVVHAVRAHHYDEEPHTIEALLLIAADAISAARPGARRESLEAYVKRLEKLEEIANSFQGVQQSYAIQAGREVRILVKPEQIDDTAAQLMARDIAKRIESELSFPGQIRVTVVRETRAIEYAK